MFPNPHLIHQPDGARPSSSRLRSRRWEEQHQEEKVAYRGVDPHYVQEVKRLAADMLVPQGEVARALLEYSLRRYEEGFLDLIPRPHPTRMRMTLYPPSPSHRKNPMKRKSRSSHSSEPSWRNMTTWRNFSPELKRTIAALASEDALHVPVGELVNALLRYGLQAHQAGRLPLKPVEKATVLTLLGKGEA